MRYSKIICCCKLCPHVLFEMVCNMSKKNKKLIIAFTVLIVCLFVCLFVFLTLN